MGYFRVGHAPAHSFEDQYLSLLLRVAVSRVISKPIINFPQKIVRSTYLTYLPTLFLVDSSGAAVEQAAVGG